MSKPMEFLDFGEIYRGAERLITSIFKCYELEFTVSPKYFQKTFDK